MNRQTNLFLVAFTIAISMVTGLRAAAPDDSEFRVFRLQHASANNIVQFVGDGVKGVERVFADARTNSLIVSASPKVLERVEEFIVALDVPNETDDHNVVGVLVLPVESCPARQLADVLLQILENNQSINVRLAVDESTNSLILAGSTASLDKVKSLVARLDQVTAEPLPNETAKNFAVRMTWLVDASDLAEPGMVEQPNATLGALVSALESQGTLKSAMTLTKNQTSVRVGGGAESQKRRFTNMSKKSGGNISMNVEGVIRDYRNNEFVIDIMTHLRPHVDDSGQSIDTTLTLPANHPVAFSISDVGPFKSAVVIEIVDAP